MERPCHSTLPSAVIDWHFSVICTVILLSSLPGFAGMTVLPALGYRWRLP
jgi:hypothetical protein